MNTTPLWVPLAVALVGLLGTAGGAIGGVLITQRRADKREADAWERELERERARWGREDAARTFEQRRAAYIDFYQANAHTPELISEYVMARLRGDKEAKSPSFWSPEAEERFQTLQIYASPRVTEVAREAQGAYQKMVLELIKWQGDQEEDIIEKLDEPMDRWKLSVHKLLAAIRKDLGIPDDRAVAQPGPSH
jgi:hypothetical protein